MIYLQILLPRKDIGSLKDCPKPRKKKDKDKEKDKEKEVVMDLTAIDEYIGRDPLHQIAQFKEIELKEVESISKLRKQHIAKHKDEEMNRQNGQSVDGQYCICRRGREGFMLLCELCKEWYHGSCVPLPRTQTGKTIGKGSAGLEAAKQLKYLCPLCIRSRRPRLETILSLLVSLQKLPVRLPEGEALQFLTERAMHWQDRARQLLADTEIANIMNSISSSPIAGVSPENLSASAALLRLANITADGDSTTTQQPLTLSEDKKAKVEELMMEGDLLEVTLDESEQLWKCLKSQRTVEECDTKVLLYSLLCIMHSLIVEYQITKYPKASFKIITVTVRERLLVL